MSECNCTMMWKIAFNKHMSVESSHLWNSKYTYCTK